MLMLIALLRIAAITSASVKLSGSAKYFSINLSSLSATASMSLSRHSFTVSFRSSGMGTSLQVMPWSLSFHTMPRLLIRSTTPLKSASAPMGTCKGTGLAPRRSRICFTTLKKSAPLRSILLTKPIRGTLYLLAWRHTVSLWGSTPPTAQNRATAPSNTRRLRSTSTVKSTWPGVSIRLILYLSPR